MTSRAALNLRRRRLAVEPLEGRRMMAVITVTDLGDGSLESLAGDGKISLREAVAAANLNASVDGSPAGDGADVIEFDSSLFATGPRTLVLTSGELAIADNLAIHGAGPNSLTIDSSGNDPTPDVDNADGARAFNVNDGDDSSVIDFTLAGITITGGDSRHGGGAILSYESLFITNCDFVGNATAYEGGAILVYGSPTTEVRSRLAGCRFVSNQSWGDDGGAASFWQLSKVSIDRCEFVHNIAGTEGGAIDAWESDLYVSKSLFAYNSAGGAFGGGAILFEDCQVSIVESTLSSNWARGGGSALTNKLSFGSLSIANSTITKNTGGDAAVTSGTVQATGSIFADNEGYDLWVPFQSSLAFNLIGRSRFPTISVTGPHNPDASGNLIGGTGADAVLAHLGPLQDNGGPTLSHAPLPGSPVIHRGDPAALAGVGDVPQYDFRGDPYSRVYGGRIDMGAVEYQPHAADFDLDGDVDGADFLTWQRGLGAADASRAEGDANADGAVNIDDLAILRAAFGVLGGATELSVPPSAAVDDPQLAMPVALARKGDSRSPEWIDAAMAYHLLQSSESVTAVRGSRHR